MSRPCEDGYGVGISGGRRKQYYRSPEQSSPEFAGGGKELAGTSLSFAAAFAGFCLGSVPADLTGIFSRWIIALPRSCFVFHQTPPASAVPMTMHTNRISITGRRWDSVSCVANPGAGISDCDFRYGRSFGCGENLGQAFAAGVSRTGVAGAVLRFGSGGFVATTGTTATGATGSLGVVTAATGGGASVTGVLTGTLPGGLTGTSAGILAGAATDGTFGGATVVVACGGRGAGSRRVAAACADSAKRSSSSGFSAPEDEFGEQAQVADVAFIEGEGPFGERFQHTDHTAAAAERNGNHGSRAEFAAGLDVTLGSVSVSSQITVCAVRKQAPEKAESRSMRAPTSGRMAPAAARRTISLFSARAMARPSAPVMATARSATSCRTSSRMNCSCGSNSGSNLAT